MAKTEKQKIGDLGEEISCNYLKNKGFLIIDRNYWKPWGEIDIIASKNGIIHFIEVKTITLTHQKSNKDQIQNNVSHETKFKKNNVSRENNSQYRAEDNLHSSKLKRLSRVIQSYLTNKCNDNTDWKFDVVIIKLDIKNKTAKVEYLKNIIL